MPRKRINQPVAIFLEDGIVLQSEYMESTADGLKLSVGTDLDKEIVLSPQQKIVHLQKLGPDRRIVANTLVKENNRLALALLTLERWSQQYASAHTGEDALQAELVIYGSGSLNLTVLENETSHDLDVAAQGKFLRFCEERAAEEPVGGEFRTLEINLASAGITFAHLGQWRSRASHLTGAFGLRFLVMHPIDTLSQKLLRVPEQEFEQKDLRHIAKILEKLRPSSETMLALLVEGVSRYSDPYAPLAAASRRNTKRFLAQHYPDLTLNQVIQQYVRAQEQNLSDIQQRRVKPMPEQDWEALLQQEEPWTQP